MREDLVDLLPYSSPQRPARVRMNTNESPFEPPRVVIDAIHRSVDGVTLNRYPDHSAVALYDALSAHTGVDPARLWVANGSNEVFLHLFLAYAGPQRTVLTFEPTYSMHTKIARMTGAQVVHGRRTMDWSIDPADLGDALSKHEPEICVFCSPNNPTGKMEDPAIIESALQRQTLVIVDEAYIEFSSAGGHLDLLERYPNLVIVRTLSKAWRLAGGRIGYAIGARDVLEELRKVSLPYGLSTISQAIGVAVLGRADAALEHVGSLRSERDRMLQGMHRFGLDPWPSDANFVLVPFPGRDDPDPDTAAKVWKGLLDAGVLVRDYSHERGLEGHLRVTAGTPEETDAFLEALREVLDQG